MPNTATQPETPASAPPLTPPLPELEKFRDNLTKAMAAKHMSASDVARAVWGSKTNAQGRMVARNRDRMTQYLAGKGYPRPETVTKLAEVLDLDPRDLEREHNKSVSTAARSSPGQGWTMEPTANPATPSGSFEFRVKGFGRVHVAYEKDVDMAFAIKLFDFLRTEDPDFNSPAPDPDDEPPV
jgi:hypothetical protein